MQPSAHIVALRDSGRSLADVAAGALDLPVRSCPEWTMADLVWHVVVVHDFWRQLVDGTIVSPGAFQPGDRPADRDLIVSYRAGLERVAATLDAADPDDEVWTWTPDHRAAFVQRRMAQETLVHSWDGHHATGVEQPIAAELAVDGVDEFLEAFLPRVAVIDGLEDGIHLHSTDVDVGGEWLIRTENGAWAPEHRHAKGAFAARGSASDLLLLLWGRRQPDELVTFGDPDVFRRFTFPIQNRKAAR